MAWATGTKIMVPQNTTTENQVAFLNTYTGVAEFFGQPVAVPAANVWHPLDFTQIGVPTNAIGIMLAGILIITSGTASVVPDIALAFQAPGASTSNPVDVYSAQAISIGPTGGARMNFNLMVPIKNGVVDFGWVRGQSWSNDGTPVTWPDGPLPAYSVGAAYGYNIWASAVVLP